MSGSATIFGIDLGTTNSLVAHLSPSGKPVSIQSFNGDILTPSEVFLDHGGVTVGKQARKAGLANPRGYAECFKRYMGESYFPAPVDGRKRRPEFLSALVLRFLRREAEPQAWRSATCRHHRCPPTSTSDDAGPPRTPA